MKGDDRAQALAISRIAQGDSELALDAVVPHPEAPGMVTTFIKGGDHRLSTPADIARLIATVEELAG